MNSNLNNPADKHMLCMKPVMFTQAYIIIEIDKMKMLIYIMHATRWCQQSRKEFSNQINLDTD